MRWVLAAYPNVPPGLVTPAVVPPTAEHIIVARMDPLYSAVPVGDDGQEGHPVWVTGSELEHLRHGRIDGGLRKLLVNAARVGFPVLSNRTLTTPLHFRRTCRACMWQLTDTRRETYVGPFLRVHAKLQAGQHLCPI
ncbi:MAG: hypothetical protein ACJAZO_004999 [Myxococcota bacterium]|jgi:hypothetical protein